MLCMDAVREAHTHTSPGLSTLDSMSLPALGIVSLKADEEKRYFSDSSDAKGRDLGLDTGLLHQRHEAHLVLRARGEAGQGERRRRDA